MIQLPRWQLIVTHNLRSFSCEVDYTLSIKPKNNKKTHSQLYTVVTREKKSTTKVSGECFSRSTHWARRLRKFTSSWKKTKFCLSVFLFLKNLKWCCDTEKHHEKWLLQKHSVALLTWQKTVNQCDITRAINYVLKEWLHEKGDSLSAACDHPLCWYNVTEQEIPPQSHPREHQRLSIIGLTWEVEVWGL